jgi:hypothetical protein
VEYEKGSPAWDIGQILTIHASVAHGDSGNCARVTSLLASKHWPAEERLRHALTTPCTCGKGDSSAEHTTERMNHGRAAVSAGGAGT